MKKFVISAIAAVVLSGAPALAADLKMVTKAPPPAPFVPWDIAFGAAIATDYNFRGISQSANQLSPFAYFEPRYKLNKDLELYVGIAGYGIDFPNRASAEIDFYGGIRPTFGPLALDFGLLYYYYPGGQCFFGGAPLLAVGAPGVTQCGAALPNGNYAKDEASFLEFYAKGVYTFNDNFNIGAGVFYTDDWLNTGADGTYGNVTAKFTGTALPNGVNWYVSGEFGKYWLGTTDTFYGSVNFPAGTPLPDYTTWNVGLGFTWKVFTLDLRYHDTNLTDSECNVLTGDHTATFNPANITPINPAGFGSKWCGSTFIAKLSADLTVQQHLK